MEPGFFPRHLMPKGNSPSLGTRRQISKKMFFRMMSHETRSLRRRGSRHSGHHLVLTLTEEWSVYAALRVKALCKKVYVSTSLLMH